MRALNNSLMCHCEEPSDEAIFRILANIRDCHAQLGLGSQ